MTAPSYRIRDLVYGLTPTEGLGEPEGVVPEDVPTVLDIDVFTVRPATMRGSTKTMHAYTGEEEPIELAVACLPRHTLQWYRDTSEKIADHLWDNNFKRDMAIVEAIRRSFGKSEADREAESDRLSRII